MLRAGARVNRDLVLLVAAGVAFFGMLVVFPAIATLAGLAGLLFKPEFVIRQLDALEGLAPAEPLPVVRDLAVELAGQATGQATVTALVSLALSLFWASRRIDNLVSGIDMAHAERESRTILVRNLVSLGLTAVLTAVLTAMALATLALAVAVPATVGAFGRSDWTDTIVTLGRWPLLGLLAMGALGVLCRYAPSRRPPRWSWVTPGAVLETLLWIGGSVLFAVFGGSFVACQLTCGASAGVVILLRYIWLTAVVVLLGRC